MQPHKRRQYTCGDQALGSVAQGPAGSYRDDRGPGVPYRHGYHGDRTAVPVRQERRDPPRLDEAVGYRQSLCRPGPIAWRDTTRPTQRYDAMGPGVQAVRGRTEGCAADHHGPEAEGTVQPERRGVPIGDDPVGANQPEDLR